MCGKGAVVQQDLRKSGHLRLPFPPPLAKPPPPPPPPSQQELEKQAAKERLSLIVRPAPLPPLTDVPDALLPALCDRFAANCERSAGLCDLPHLIDLKANATRSRDSMENTTGSTRFTHPTLGTVTNHFRGRWIQLMGDSSLRAVWLSLYQQLVSGNRANPGMMDLRHWALIVQPFNRSLRSVDYDADVVQRFEPFSWIDVILEEHSNGWRVQKGTFHQGIPPIPDAVLKAGGDAWGFGLPMPDQSDLLTPRWCSRTRSRSQSYVRLTFQMVTQSKFAARMLVDNYAQWRISACPSERVAGGPDAMLLTTGAWDMAAGTAPGQSRTSLVRALAAMREESQISGRLVGFASVLFAPKGVALGGRSACSDRNVVGRSWCRITWQRAIVDEVNEGSNGSHVAFIDRALPTNILQTLAPNCFRTTVSRFVPSTTLELEVALEAGATKIMEDTYVWHPPIGASVALLPSLLELWLGGRSMCNYSNYRSVAPATCRMLVDLLTSNGSDTGRGQCCGKRPLPADLDHGHTEYTSYLARQCRRRPAHVPSMCPLA